MTLLQAKCSINSLRYGAAKDFWITMFGENDSSYTVRMTDTVVASDNSIFFLTENEKDTSADVLVVGRINKDGTINWAKTISYAGSNLTTHTGGSQKTVRDSSDNLYFGFQSLATYGPFYGVNSSGTRISGIDYYASSTNFTTNSLVSASSNVASLYIAHNDSAAADSLFSKIDATTGAISWQRRVAGQSATLHARCAIATDSSYNLYFFTGDTTADDWTLGKFSPSGTFSWSRNFDFGASTTAANPADAVCDSSGNVVFLANDGTNVCYYVAKVDASSDVSSTNFVTTWVRKLSLSGATSSGISASTCLDSLGNVYVSLTTQASGVPSRTFIVKYDSSGSIQWQREVTVTIGSGKTIASSNLAVDSENNLIFAARYQGNIQYNNGTSGQYGNILAKLPNDGSGTGTYTIGPATVGYSASSLTDVSASITKSAVSHTVTTPNILTITNTYTNTSTTLLGTKVKV